MQKIVQTVRSLRRVATKMGDQISSVDINAELRQAGQTLLVITDRLVEATNRAFSTTTNADPVSGDATCPARW